MSYTTESGRHEILDAIADAVDRLKTAVGALGEAYELLDEHTADLMEERLFRPLQGALAQLGRTSSEFSARTGVRGREFVEAPAVLPVAAAVGIEQAADAIADADDILSELQDSMLPVEVGDRELRDGLSRARVLLAPLDAEANELMRRIGR